MCGCRAFFAEVFIHDKTYFMLIDTGSEVSWLFCEPPFSISKDNPKLAVSVCKYFVPSIWLNGICFSWKEIQWMRICDIIWWKNYLSSLCFSLQGPNGLYRPSLDNMMLYKDLHPSGFHACYQDQYLCRNICYLGGLVVKVLMVKETFVMQQIDMSKTSTKLVFGCEYFFILR